jgi:autophagy-related protein 17
MDILRSTTVASHLRPTGEPPRSLLDFIDEEALERIRATLKADIDLTADNNVDYHTLLENFASDKQRIIYVMKQAASLDDEELDDLKNLIDELESHAEEMAVGLTSLTAHFDLASKAVLHTEGGYNALQHAASNNELPEGVTAQDVIPSSQSTADTTPISAAERHEMLNVLAGDAAQVPEVIAEIEEHHNAMRNILSSIQETLQYIDTAFKGTRDAFEVLQSFEVRLPHYTTYPNEYVHAWTQYKSDLLNSTAELNRLNEFYMDYLESYAKLLEEVDRRASTEEQMRAKLEMAVNRVEQIREADKEMRDRFRAEVGDFLPVDIFPGLVEDAPRYRVVVVDDIGMSFKSNEDAFERAVEEGFEGEQQE